MCRVTTAKPSFLYELNAILLFTFACYLISFILMFAAKRFILQRMTSLCDPAFFNAKLKLTNLPWSRINFLGVGTHL